MSEGSNKIGFLQKIFNYFPVSSSKVSTKIDTSAKVAEKTLKSISYTLSGKTIAQRIFSVLQFSSSPKGETTVVAPSQNDQTTREKMHSRPSLITDEEFNKTIRSNKKKEMLEERMNLRNTITERPELITDGEFLEISESKDLENNNRETIAWATADMINEARAADLIRGQRLSNDSTNVLKESDVNCLVEFKSLNVKDRLKECKSWDDLINLVNLAPSGTMAEVELEGDRMEDPSKAIFVLAEYVRGLDLAQNDGLFDSSEKKYPNISVLKDELLKNIKAAFDQGGVKGSDIQEIFQKEFKKQDAKVSKMLTEYVGEIRGRLLERCVKKEHKINVDRKEQAITEKMTVVDTKLGKGYLDAVLGEEAKKYVPTGGDTGAVRVSTSKTLEHLQGVSMNLERHEILNEKGETCGVVMHSGAPCTHGKKPDFEKLQKKMTKGQISESEKADMDLRINLATAQALPKVLDGIKTIMEDETKRSAAIITGVFLYVEQSLVSSLNNKEKQMALEERAAFQNIGDKLIIEFGDTESIKIDDKGFIQVTLKKEEHWGEVSGKFQVKTPLFLQGVNIDQSLGEMTSRVNFLKSLDQLQQEINRNGFAELKNYYEILVKFGINTGDMDRAMQALDAHFSSGDADKSKDVNGMMLIQDAIYELFGVGGVNCKSGKDRTGKFFPMVLARQFFAKQPEVREGEERNMADVLSGAESASYDNTGRNTGKNRGFAFNALQRQFLPPEMRPPANLCNSSAST
jgi:hypothetical protein